MNINDFKHDLNTILGLNFTPFIICGYDPNIMDNSLEVFSDAEGDLVFNISPVAIRSPRLDFEKKEFNFIATFQGKKKSVKVPTDSIKYLIAKELHEGL